MPINLGVDQASALPGRDVVMPVPSVHAVLGTSLEGDFSGYEKALFALGCFWGAERLFWQLDGVYSTSVGYTAGFTPNPSYQEVCSGKTGHTEAVLVVFDPKVMKYQALLQVFWQSHDPTQGMGQGNDRGTQYRSGIYTFGDEQLSQASESRQGYQSELKSFGFSAITTEITSAGEFYYAEESHQQYLHKNPSGYCGIGGTGVSCPVNVTP